MMRVTYDETVGYLVVHEGHFRPKVLPETRDDVE